MINPCLCLSIYLTIHLSIHVCIYDSIYLYVDSSKSESRINLHVDWETCILFHIHRIKMFKLGNKSISFYIDEKNSSSLNFEKSILIYFHVAF